MAGDSHTPAVTGPGTRRTTLLSEPIPETVIESALKLHGGKPIINSINFEDGEAPAAVLARVEQLKGQLIPADVRVVETRNYGETATDPENGIECLPHSSPLAAALLGLTVGKPTPVNLPAGPATLTVLSIRNPTQAELDRLLTKIKPPEIEKAE